MIAIPLNRDEILAFTDRHLFWNFPSIPPEGKYIWDDQLNGNILVYPKTDGTNAFVWTSITDTASISIPGTASYVLAETAKAVAVNSQGLLVSGSNYFKYAVFLAIAVLLFLSVRDFSR